MKPIKVVSRERPFVELVNIVVFDVSVVYPRLSAIILKQYGPL